MAVLNMFPKVPLVLDSTFLTSLGFTNVPAGYWMLKSTAFGDTQPNTDHSTIIPLVGKGYQNKHTGSDQYGHTHNMNLKLNNRTMYSAVGKKTVDGVALGGLFTDVQSTKFFYPFWYDFNLTSTLSGVTKEGDRSVNLEDALRPCCQIYLWLEKMTSSPTKANRGMNFPVGSWTIATSSSDATDIPLLAEVTSTNKINSVEMIGGWNYGTNNPQSGASYSMTDRHAYGIFLPGAYDFDMTSTQNGKSSITGTSGYTVTHWLVRTDL